MNCCPKDGEILASNDVSGYRYYSCERCGGCWIPGASLHRVLSAQGVEEFRAVPVTGKGDVDCPECHAPSQAVVIEECRLDHCGTCHGVWLDPGEVTRVRRLFPEGSAVVDADANRPPNGGNTTWGAWSVVDVVGNLLLLLGR